MPSALAIMALLVTPMLSHGQVVPAFFLRLTSAVIPFTPPRIPPWRQKRLPECELGAKTGQLGNAGSSRLARGRIFWYSGRAK